MDHTLFLMGGLLLGCLHALDADHISTVSALILERNPLRRTFLLALRWSLGHSLTLLVLAGGMMGMRDTFETLDLSKAEHWVGFSMIGLGLWILGRQWNGSREPRGKHTERASAGWILFGMGVLHGTAGSSSIVLLIPVALSQSASLVLAYVVCFSLGMVMTMGLYAFVVHRVVWLERLSGHVVRLRGLAALVTVGIGIGLLR